MKPIMSSLGSRAAQLGVENAKGKKGEINMLQRRGKSIHYFGDLVSWFRRMPRNSQVSHSGVWWNFWECRGCKSFEVSSSPKTIHLSDSFSLSNWNEWLFSCFITTRCQGERNMDPPQLNFLKFSELRHSLCHQLRHRRTTRPTAIWNASLQSANQKIKQKQNEFQINEINFCGSNPVANGH